MSDSLADLSAVEIARRVRRGETSAGQLVQAHLERIAAVEGRAPATGPYTPRPGDDERVHAYISLQAERALARAAEIDAAVARGEDPGPLAGVPLSVKDIFCVAGTASTAASKMLESYVAPYTATPVARLEAAGAIVLGKVNLDEYTFGSSSESSAFQPSSRNPWDCTRVPGGSSGGSAAAVAAGESALSLGTDTAGSIRQPAAFCGVVGVKPTYGRVSRYGLIAFGSSLDCPGPLARNARDAALMLNHMAGADPRDATAVTVPVPDYTAGLGEGVRGLRIGLSPDYFRIRYPDPETGEVRDQDLPDEMTGPIWAAAEVLRQAGAEIVENVPMPNTHLAVPAYFVISRVEAASNLHRFDGVKYGYRTRRPVDDLWSLIRQSRGEAFGLQPKLRILMGMYVSGAQYAKQYYQRALQVRTLIRRDFEAALDPRGAWRCDALLTPTTPTPAFKVGAVYGDSVLMQYADLLTVPANHSGSPGLSAPCGLSAEGLPLGLQLLGRDWEEATLLRIAATYEALTAGAAWRGVRPAVLRKGVLP
ncbi:MAG: Asp-tRNA(Asn)/Glu-tRNA(Gln) amidotransferase subunit GatA [Anaerolineales bacterium]|nr:Asp-tRNA(Asn)/Glu-tRNA(Gln) amidotransferase subunit GatA [Anaerolineales bacterium]